MSFLYISFQKIRHHDKEVMALLGVLMLLWSIAVWPVAIKLQASVGDDFLPQGFIRIRTIGLVLRIDFVTRFDARGLHLALRFAGRNKQEHDVKPNPAMQKRMLKIIKDKTVQRNLMAYLHDFQLKGDVRIGLRDAAATAIMCGAVNAVLNAFEHVSVCASPDFRSETFCAQIKCITTFCLGKLFSSAAVCLKAWTAQQLHHFAGGALHGLSASDWRRDANGA